MPDKSEVLVAYYTSDILGNREQPCDTSSVLELLVPHWQSLFTDHFENDSIETLGGQEGVKSLIGTLKKLIKVPEMDEVKDVVFGSRYANSVRMSMIGSNLRVISNARMQVDVHLDNDSVFLKMKDLVGNCSVDIEFVSDVYEGEYLTVNSFSEDEQRRVRLWQGLVMGMFYGDVEQIG